MSAWMTRVWIMVGWALVCIVINIAIYNSEQHLRDGQLIYLELAPVDPRSLMQGDYMALQFALANDIRRALQAGRDVPPGATDGRAIVRVDANGVARFESLQSDRQLAQNQLALTYRLREGRVKFATDAYFFQEGHAQRYENARYGAFRVSSAGDMLLVSLHDEALTRLGSALPN